MRTAKGRPFQKQLHAEFDGPREEKPVRIVFDVVDLFCGAGGVTSGIEAAEVGGSKVAEVICAINHDRKAIESHWQNHPQVTHFVEDITKFNVKLLPKPNPNAKRLLWASLECTNHSNAKGGLPRDADSRTLGEHLPPYIKEYRPDYIGIENVREFRDWGPLIQKLDADGKPMVDKDGSPFMIPDKRFKGVDYQKWKKSILDLGYHAEEKILNSADFGAHTSRRRFFIIFAKEGLPIVWPQPTHHKTGANGLQKWRPVKECLDFTDKGESIFGRPKNLSTNTYKRIYAGLVKYIAHGDLSFLTQYNGAGNDSRIAGENAPCRTVTTANRFAVVQPSFIAKYYGTGENVSPVDAPAPTLTTKDRLSLIQAEQAGEQKEGFLVNPQYDSAGSSLDKPAPTLIARQDKRPISVVQTEHWLAKYNSSHNNTQQNAGADVNQPAPTITARPGLGVVAVDRFIDMQHGSGKQSESIEEPVGAIMTVPKKNLVTVEHMIDQQHGASVPQSVEVPANAIMTNPKQNLITAYVMNTNYSNVGVSLDDPCFSLVSSRRHPYLVQLETGQMAIAIEPTDTEIMRKIKMFMAAYGIVAIFMRMLRVKELLKITGFPENYILVGTQADKKKYIGNAVPPVVPKAMIEALSGVEQNESLKVEAA